MCPLPGFDAGWRWLGLILALVALPVFAPADPLPDYLRTALAHFSPNPPAGWAYTLATTRNNVRMVERFDPSRPGRPWTLLEWEGRTPTADEVEKYARSRPQAGSGGSQSNFQREDIEPGSLRLVREDNTQAEWTGGFRETSAGPDKMLGHLTLRLVADKRLPHIVSYALELKEPYSPVLGVKMNRLTVEGRFLAPTADRPALPAAMNSNFVGSIFFISTGENLHLDYRDYAPPASELSR